MKWAALSPDGKTVENLIVATQEFVDSQAPRVFVALPANGPVVQIGDTYTGTKFVPATPDLAALKAALASDVAAASLAVQSLADGSLAIAVAAAATPEELAALRAKLGGL